MNKPNILFIMADQLGAAALGCYGSGVDSTPTLDALAAQGVRFDRCYATSPVCAPNRATILTGRSPCVHGIISNNYALATDMPTYAHVLQAPRLSHRRLWQVPPDAHALPGARGPGLPGLRRVSGHRGPQVALVDWVEREHPEHYERALAMVWPWPNHPRPERAHLADEARAKDPRPTAQRHRRGK